MTPREGVLKPKPPMVHVRCAECPTTGFVFRVEW